jgi:tetratricopeptide (TPR) repeat protein
VAWVSERKDVLSAFFFLLTLLAYARYVELAKTRSSKRWPVYGLGLLFFALGLMAKPMLVTLPGVLCLLDFWPLNRFQLPLKGRPWPVLWRLAAEKIPFVILAAFSCGITFIAQSTGYAVKPMTQFPLDARLAHVPVSYAWYVLKLIWPANLSVYYLLHTGYSSQTVTGALLLLAGMTALAIWQARPHPYLLVGWLWFAGMLAPVLGIVQVGNQAYADRYTYLPYIGLFIILAWGIPELLSPWPYSKPVLLAGALLASAACCKLTVEQVHLWESGQTLFERALALDPENEEAWALLGLQSMNQGKVDKAIDCLRRATAINPRYHYAWHDLAGILFLKGDYAEAEDAYQMALLYTPDKVEIYNNLGDLFRATGRYGEAITNYQNSLELAPNQPEIQTRLGQCFVGNRQPDRATVEFQTAIRLQPDNAEAQLGLAMILESTGRNAEAQAHYWKTIELATNSITALNNLAWLLAADADPRLRNGNQAVQLAGRACELTHYQQAFLIGTLAAAYAEAGRFKDATAAAQKAQDVALAHGQKEIADRNGRLMKLYQTGHAYHVDTRLPP